MRNHAADITEVGITTRKYLKEFSNLPSLTLAKKLHADKPELYPTVENARMSIRHHRGAHGKTAREQLIDKTFIRVELPEPDMIDLSPFVLPKQCEKILIMSDVHLPYHDKAAVEAAVEFGVKHEVDTVILNGDIVDDYHFSSFVRDVNRRSAKGEIEMLVAFLKYIDDRFPKAYKVYKAGNHEERMTRYIKTHAAVLWNIAAIDIPDILSQFYGYDMAVNGWHWVTDMRIVKAGKMNIIHGHEIQGGGQVNIARNLFLRTYDNVVKGHSHRKNEDVIKTITDSFYGSWATGCLCNLHAEWNPFNQWTHGFGYLKLNTDSTFRMNNIQIIEGRVM